MTSIEWTDETWNPVTGCSKVSTGCDNCYAEALAVGRLKGKPGYPGLPWTPENAAVNVVLRPERLDQPMRWREPRMVFVNSMSDLFHPRVSGEFIAQVFDVMERCPQHIFQVLTKRPKRMASWTRKFRPEPLPNVWLGTSVEDQHWANQRVPALLDAVAAVRFLSCEPLLGPITFRWASWVPVRGAWHLDGLKGIDWMIVGGESGQNHRGIDAEWVRTLRDECAEVGAAFFFKQWGGIRPKSGGRLLDGRTWDEMPTAQLQLEAA